MSESDNGVTVGEVLSGDIISTTTGQKIRIANTYPFPSEELAKNALQDAIGGKCIVLQLHREDGRGACRNDCLAEAHRVRVGKGFPNHLDGSVTRPTSEQEMSIGKGIRLRLTEPKLMCLPT